MLYEELESALLMADAGVAATQFLLDDLKRQAMYIIPVLVILAAGLDIGGGFHQPQVHRRAIHHHGIGHHQRVAAHQHAEHAQAEQRGPCPAAKL